MKETWYLFCKNMVYGFAFVPELRDRTGAEMDLYISDIENGYKRFYYVNEDDSYRLEQALTAKNMFCYFTRTCHHEDPFSCEICSVRDCPTRNRSHHNQNGPCPDCSQQNST